MPKFKEIQHEELFWTEKGLLCSKTEQVVGNAYDTIRNRVLTFNSDLECFRANKTVVIARGLPGSGKSTLSQKVMDILNSYMVSANVFGSDSYFMEDGVYKFDANKLKEAHNFNQQNATLYLGIGGVPIIDNTNTIFKEIEPYIRMAKTHNYDVVVIESNTPWAQDVNECYNRNVHGVPLETLQRMKNRFEDSEVIRQKIKEYNI